MAKKEPDLTRVGECLWRHQSLKYYAIVRVGGKQIKRSLKTKDLALAKRNLRKFREKVERVGGQGKSMRFGSSILVFNETCFNVPTLGTLYKTAAQDALQQLAESEPGLSSFD